MKKLSTHSLAAASILGLSSSLLALELPTIFTDNMVLQRDQAVPVWGDSTPGSQVTVSFGTQTLNTTADENGDWKITLASLAASADPAELKVSSGENSITFNNVLVGEVWLCSGQSNMEWSLARSADHKLHIPAATDPLIRLYRSPKVASPHQLPEIDASWQVLGLIRPRTCQQWPTTLLSACAKNWGFPWV